MKGFTGTIATRFSERTNEAIQRAGEVHSRDPFEGRRQAGGEHYSPIAAMSHSRMPISQPHTIRHTAVHSPINRGMSFTHVQPPQLSTPLNQRPPFSMESSSNIRQATGIGNSSNIVMEQSVYDHVVREVDRADDQAGAEIYRCCMEIEQMCQNTFVVPETISRILAITGQVKGSLGQFRSLTEDVNISTRSFSRNLVEIDGSVTFAASDLGSSNAISQATMAVERQIDSMDRTGQNFKMQVTRLNQQVTREEANLERINSRLDNAYSRRNRLRGMPADTNMAMMSSFTEIISANRSSVRGL